MSLLDQTEVLYKRWKLNDELSVQKTPLGLSGIFLNLLIDHFTHNSIQFKYSENPTETRILIDLHKRWNPSNCENYPGIYIKRQSWNPRTKGRTLSDYKSFDLPDGVEYWVSIASNFSFICVGKNSGEIELLLHEVGIYFTVFWEPICKFLNFNEINMLGISPVMLVHEAKEYRSGQVDLESSFDFIWKLTLEKPLLRKVKVDVQA